MLVPQNLYTTMSGPDFVSYMGIGNGEIRMDIRMTEDIGKASEMAAAELSENTTVNLSVETGDHTVFPVIYSKGRYPEKENVIALSSMKSKELGLDVGSELYLTSDGKKEIYCLRNIFQYNKRQKDSQGLRKYRRK